MGCCLGFLDDQPWEHYVHSGTQHSLGGETRKYESLEDFLSRESPPTKKKYYPSDPPLAVESLMLDRCILALALASAVSHLHNTPWLSGSWGAKDVYFIEGGERTRIGWPYVSKSFATTSLSKKSPPMAIDETVFALGVVLIELSYGKPILSHQTAGDLDHKGNVTSYTKGLIASRLLDEIDEREATNYANAVRWCITGNFDPLSFSLDNKEFRESFYEGVIQPLQLNYKSVM